MLELIPVDVNEEVRRPSFSMDPRQFAWSAMVAQQASVAADDKGSADAESKKLTFGGISIEHTTGASARSGGQAGRGHGRGGNRGGRTKIREPSPDEDGEYYCEACEKGFNTEAALDAHVEKHVSCPAEGCLFRASAKAVKLHQEQAHTTARVPKAVSLDTPEEIARWREERKAKYPTDKNIQKKADLEKKIGGDVGGSIFAPQSERGGYSEVVGAVKGKGALGLVQYGSSEEDGEVEEKDTASKASPNPKKRPAPKKQSCKFFMRGKCTKGEKCPRLHEAPPKKPDMAAGAPNQAPKRQSALLKKLLDKEIRKEKSVIMQLLAFFAENKLMGDSLQVERKTQPFPAVPPLPSS